jgi:hypothetical protein
VLSDAVDDLHALGQAAALEGASERGTDVVQDRVRVTVEAAEGRESAARAQISAARGVIEQRHGRWFQVSATLSGLEQIAAGDAVRFVSRTRTGVPQVVSEGTLLINADVWQQGGLTGAGTKIAIFDLGFQDYQSRLGTELPASITPVNFRSDGIFNDGVHGTAVAEIVYDTAPGAQMYLVAVDSDTSLGLAADWAITEGIDVISMSLAFLGSGTGDGTGPANDAADAATAAGIVWVNSAGNYAETHWSGPWSDADADDWLNFSGTDETNGFFVSQGATVTALLLWDDPWAASCNDYDLWVYNSAGTVVVGSSLSPQDCASAPPGEAVTFTSPSSSTYQVKIGRFAADGAATFDLFLLSAAPQYVTADSSIIPPADNQNVISVGAVPYWVPNSIEPFSSRGPTNDGRLAPRLVGPDRVSTSVYGDSAFGGTSASAPHIAGAAALVLELNPCFSRADVQSFLESRSLDIGPAGDDNTYGNGRLDLQTVPAGACTTPTPSPSPSPTPTPTPTPTPVLPDLIVQSIAMDPASPLEWEGTEVTVTVQNTGAGGAGPFSVDFYRDRASAPAPAESGDYTCQSTGLSPGATFGCVFTTSYLDPGVYDTWAQADTQDEDNEADEGNNIAGPQALTVNTAPDADADGVPDFADNCDLWSNPAQTLPSWPVPANDLDCDGFDGALEAYLGTDAAEQCPAAPAHDAWPVDLDRSGSVDILDVLNFKPAFGSTVPPSASRYDLAQDASIDILDVLTVKPFFGSVCTVG